MTDILTHATQAVINVLEQKDKNTWFMILSEDNYDLLVKKLVLDGNHVDYYLDRVDLPTYLLSPELLDIIINKVFIRTTQNVMELKNKYKLFPYFSPKIYLDINLCLPLTDTLLSCCRKRAMINCRSNARYGPIGNSSTETLEQQIENFIQTDRCDRIFPYPKILLPIEETINKILEEHGKKIKLTKVLLSSFSHYINNNTDKFIYVIDDL